MLRAVVATNDNPIKHEFDPAEMLSTYMFDRAMALVWSGWYQVLKMTMTAPAPTVTEKFEAMSPLKQKESLHDQKTGVISFNGQIIISKDTHEFSCVCTLHNRKFLWEPHWVTLTIAGQRHDFTFRLIRGVDFDICKATQADNEGPQPAKV